MNAEKNRYERAILLQPYDSQRVADELINSIKQLTDKTTEKIEETDLDINSGVRIAIQSLLHPKRNDWYEDWLPLSVEYFLDHLRDGIVSSVEGSIDRRISSGRSSKKNVI